MTSIQVGLDKHHTIKKLTVGWMKGWLFEWLKEMKYQRGDWKDYIKSESEERICFELYTDEHIYHISASTHLDVENDKGYLGCTGSTRKPSAGETWNRGNDLRDGNFSYKTWIGILADIVGFELVSKVKPCKPATCEVKEDSESSKK